MSKLPLTDHVLVIADCRLQTADWILQIEI